MPAARDITGMKFGRLVALQCIGSDKFGKRLWEFDCECGKRKTTTAASVIAGKTRSCGCLFLEQIAINSRNGAHKVAASKTKHGQSKARTPEYGVWKTMRQRCTNPRNQDYPAYGGRGIEVCERWNDYATFFADMGIRPTSHHSIDRINTNGNYEPDNCRWATNFEQAANRRPRGTGEYALKKGASCGDQSISH